jgi:hypothetical protein
MYLIGEIVVWGLGIYLGIFALSGLTSFCQMLATPSSGVGKKGADRETKRRQALGYPK